MYVTLGFLGMISITNLNSLNVIVLHNYATQPRLQNFFFFFFFF